MSNKNVNVQDNFLNGVRKKETKFTLFLTNGYVYAQCKLISYDSYAIFFTYKEKDSIRDGVTREGGTKQAMVYKHAISTFQPNEWVDMSPQDDKAKSQSDAK